MSKNPLFKKDSDIFTHIFWVTLTAAMTVKRQRSCTVLPRHRDQSQPSHSREQQLQPHASRWRRRVVQSDESPPCLRPPIVHHGPFLRYPSSAHSAKWHWSSPNPRINPMLIDKLDTKKKRKQSRGDGYLWTIFMRQHCLFGQGKKNPIPTLRVHLNFRMLRIL